jgi:hypothetical protein
LFLTYQRYEMEKPMSRLVSTFMDKYDLINLYKFEFCETLNLCGFEAELFLPLRLKGTK